MSERLPEGLGEGESADAAGDLTRLLAAWREGDEAAHAELLRRVYPRLRRLAGAALRRHGGDLSLDPTEVVHELYLQLQADGRVGYRNRVQFFAFAARIVRDVLVSHRRRRTAKKRGGGTIVTEWVEVPHEIGQPVDVLTIDQALRRLEVLDRGSARIVELRCFGGLTVDEVAGVLGVGRATVGRRWRFALAYLRQELAS